MMMRRPRKLPPPPAAHDGRLERDRGIAQVEHARKQHVNRACRTLIHLLIEHGQATADDVRAAMTLPPDVTPNLYGAAFQKLKRVGLIEAIGFDVSNRSARHAGINRIWRLTDPVGAQHWLCENPVTHDNPDGDGGAV